MDVYVKETLYVIDYNNNIPDAELRNTIFVSDDHITPGYAYNIVIKEANTGYSDLTFSMPNTIIDNYGNSVKNPKLELLVPLVKVRYRRQVYYTGENEIHVIEPEGYGDAAPWQDRIYSPLFPNNIIEDYVMDYVVQPVDKKRNVLEIATNFTAIDYPRFTLSKKKVGLLIDNDTITRPEWSIVNPGAPMDRPGMIKYKAWNKDLSKIVLNAEDYDTEEQYEAACEAMCKWNPMTTNSYPLNRDQVEKLKSDQSQWPYGFEATCFYWPIEETGRYKGILYEEGGWIGFQGYDLLGLQIAGLDPELHTTNTAWHWTQIYAMENYLTPNNARNYLSFILDGTAWKVGDVDKRMTPVYNPSTGLEEGEVEYQANLSLSGSNCYNAITSLCQNFQLYPVFDCLTRTVHLRIASGKNYGLVYRLGDNIKSDSTKADGEKVITKLYVSGGSDNVGSANINIGTATREYFQNFQGFYASEDSLKAAEVKGKWAVVDDSLTDFNTTVYELDYYNDTAATPVLTMPEASVDILGEVYRYTGTTTDEFTNNFCYKCVEKYDDKHEEVTYGWLDVTGTPYLKPVQTQTHNLEVPNYWVAGPNRKVYYYDNGPDDTQKWVEGTLLDDGNWQVYYWYKYIIDGQEAQMWAPLEIDPISGAVAPWDPNDDMYIMGRSPYWTNYIMNLRWYYQNNWITKEQILELYQSNLKINNLNKAFGDKYIEDRRATQTAYENAKNNYDIAQDGYESTLYAMENKYYLEDGDYTQGYDYAFHTPPKDVFERTEAGVTNYYVKLFHCYNCGYTAGVPSDGRVEGNDWDTCPECASGNVVNNSIPLLIYQEGKYHTNEKSWPYGTDYTHIYGKGYVGGYQYNPQLKGYFLRLVTALDKMDAREKDRWDVKYYENNVSMITPIPYEWNDDQELVFDQYTYKLDNVYVRSTSGQIEVWNEAVRDYIKYYGRMLDYKLILDASIKHIEELEEVYESWNTIVQSLYQQQQDNFGDFIVEGNYQNADQPHIPILFNEGLEASDKYSIPEVTYNLDVVDATGLVEYRYPGIRKYTCEYCGYTSYRQPKYACFKCGKFPLYREEEPDIYNDLVRKLHSVGQIVPKAGDYVSIYDEPMGFFGVPGLITEVDRYLDSPIRNSIRIDTSYTDADTLVGNIINATNTVLSNKDIYARTAFINGDGTINPDSIKDTLNTSGADISIVSTNGGILLNGQGLRCIDPSNPKNAIKYTGTGIYKTTNLDNENGEGEAVIWERMMTPEGINATYINSGTIDTNKINITAGSGSKVIVDKFGLYVKTSTNASAHITEFSAASAKSNPNYATHWGEINNIASFVGVDNKNNPLIYTRGFLVANEGSNIANWITSDEGFYHLSYIIKYGCPECGSQYSTTFTVCPHCQAEVTPEEIKEYTNNKDLWLSPEGQSNTINGFGSIPNLAIFANNNFGVTTDGIMYAQGAHINGSGTFSGNITINTGNVGDWQVIDGELQNLSTKPTIVLSATGNAITDSVGAKYVCQSDNNHVFTSYRQLNNGKCPTCGGTIETTEAGSGLRSDWAIFANNNFGVTTGGDLYASNAYIKGEITATSGTIGGCSITNGVLYVGDTNISGRISANHLDAKTITTDNFSSQNISASQITSGRISTDYLSTSVITTSNFSAQEINADKITSGSLTCSRITGGTLDIGSLEAYSTGTGRSISYHYYSPSSGEVITTVAAWGSNNKYLNLKANTILTQVSGTNWLGRTATIPIVVMGVTTKTLYFKNGLFVGYVE